MKNFYRVMGMLKPYILSSALAFLMMLLFTAAEYITPLFLKEAIDNGIGKRNMQVVGQVVALMALLVTFRSVTAYFQGYFMERASQKIAYGLRNQLYARLQKLSFSFFDRHQTGQIMSRMTGDVECEIGRAHV